MARQPEQIMEGMKQVNKTIWTLGNLLMLVGVYLLAVVGGLLADERYSLLAAQGGSDIQLPPVVQQATETPQVLAMAVPEVTPTAGGTARPTPGNAHAAAQEPGREDRSRFHLEFNKPEDGQELNSVVPQQDAGFGPNTITRIEIPKILVDRKVQEVGWRTEVQNGVSLAIWDVAKFTVGHHKNTANPGQPGNIVLAGHSGGTAYPFNDLYYVRPGDKIILWSNGQRYSYTATERLILDEIGPKVTTDQRLQNARYIEPLPTEAITLVTCWPLTGANRFTQRVVIRGTPDAAAGSHPALTATPAH